MDAEVFQRIAAVVAEPGKRSERAQDAADLIRHATRDRRRSQPSHARVG
jgi:hypothetical protein